jgi:hypothetical protein
MKWDSLFGGRSLESVRQARLDQYFRLYQVDFGEPVPDYVAEHHDLALQLELLWNALRRGAPLEPAPTLRKVG